MARDNVYWSNNNMPGSAAVCAPPECGYDSKMSRFHHKVNRHRSSQSVSKVLSQRIRELYRDKLGKNPGEISCFLAQKSFTVVIEDSLTQVEHRLINAGKADLSIQVREDLRKSTQSHLKEIVESALQRTVVDILSDTTLETGCTGIIFILSG